MMSRTKSTQEIFDQIYIKDKWLFGSGTGSIYFFNKPFVCFVNNFLTEHPDVKTIIDIGCGDMQIARHFVLGEKKYIGCDVSKTILDRVRKKYSSASRRFVLFDAVSDPLPVGDLAIVKDVLIHLSNADIQRLLQKLQQYRYVILQTSTQGDSKNSDIVSGEFRPLDILRPPFSASDYKMELQYTVGLLKPVNFFLSLAGIAPKRKQVYVRG